jgi:hypothetical protein
MINNAPVLGVDTFAPQPCGRGKSSRCFIPLSYIPLNPKPTLAALMTLYHHHCTIADLGGIGERLYPEP